MSKRYRPWKIDEPMLLPATVQEFVDKDHLARFVLSLVVEEIDLEEIEGVYRVDRGQPPFDPAMMTALLLYGYCNGVYSSRRIAKACRERVDFMSIVGLDPPDFRTISEFRKRHLNALSALFGQVLRLCERAGLVKLGHVALDGTKIKANASKHKAMSYERMGKRAEELEAEVAGWMDAAAKADASEDAAFGRDKSGEEMPAWVGDKKRRAEKIRAAKAELEAEARAAAEAEREARAEAEKKREAEGRKKPGRPAAPPSEAPDPKAQKNFTDPESRIMKTKDGFIQGYNAQAAVDAEAQVIVAHGLDANGTFAVEAADGRLVDVAVAAVDLHGFARRVDGDLGRVELRHRRRLADRPSLLAQPGGLVDEIAGVLHRDRHVGALERDRLVAADGTAERLALLRVRDRRVETGGGHTECECGDRDAAVVENAQEGLEPFAAHAEHVILGDTQPSKMSSCVSEACHPILR